jgi:hypothetical protein
MCLEAECLEWVRFGPSLRLSHTPASPSPTDIRQDNQVVALGLPPGYRRNLASKESWPKDFLVREFSNWRIADVHYWVLD